MKRSDRLADAFGSIDEKYVDEALNDKPAEAKAKNKKTLFRVFAVAAVIAVAALLIILPSLNKNDGADIPPKAVEGPDATEEETAKTEETVGTDTPEPVYNVIWGDENALKNENEDKNFEWYVLNAEKYGEGAVFPIGFVGVDAGKDFWDDGTVELNNELMKRQENLRNVSASVENRLIEGGMTNLEASLRKHGDPELIKAKEEYAKEAERIKKKMLTDRLSKSEELFEYVKDNCVKVLCAGDFGTDGQKEYLWQSSGFCLALVDAEQLKTLYYSEKFDFMWVVGEGYDKGSLVQYGLGSELDFAPDSKLTLDLLNACGENGGEKIRVDVYINLPEREPDEYDLMYGEDFKGAAWARAAAQFGMTLEEFENCRDDELVDRVMEWKRNYQNMTAERDEIISRVFKDGEVVERVSGVVAELTPDRVKEVASDPSVAAVSLENEINKNYVQIPVIPE